MHLKRNKMSGKHSAPSIHRLAMFLLTVICTSITNLEARHVQRAIAANSAKKHHVNRHAMHGAQNRSTSSNGPLTQLSVAQLAEEMDLRRVQSKTWMAKVDLAILESYLEPDNIMLVS